MIKQKEEYNPNGWLLLIFFRLVFSILFKVVRIKNNNQLQYIKIIAYLLVFICLFLLFSCFRLIHDVNNIRNELLFTLVFFIFSFILEYKYFPYWIDGENQDDFKKNALTQLDILQNAYNKHNMSLVLEHLQYLQTVVEEERFEELHKIENLESVWKMKSKLEMIFKEIEKETAKLQGQTYRKEIKKPLNLLKDYLDLLRVSEE